MSRKLYLGIDNGVSGTIGYISDKFAIIDKTPVMKVQDYTKAKKNISRINVTELTNEINTLMSGLQISGSECFALLERPMVNPTRFASTVSAARALEATLNVLELLGIPYAFIDSKEWQKSLLPSGCSGDELKSASYDIGTRLFPGATIKHPDKDGLLIAEYARRKNY